MARAVNPYVTWDLTRKSNFSSSEKAKIRRAYDALKSQAGRTMKMARVRRSPGESQSAYRRRLAALKRAHGVEGSPLAAIPVRVSKTESVSIRGRKVRVKSRKTGRVQWFVRADAIGLALDPRAEAARLWAIKTRQRADRAFISLGKTRYADFKGYTNLEDLADAFEEFAALYQKEFTYIITGLILEKGGGTKRRPSAAR